jgi:hypothetical protein
VERVDENQHDGNVRLWRNGSQNGTVRVREELILGEGLGERHIEVPLHQTAEQGVSQLGVTTVKARAFSFAIPHLGRVHLIPRINRDLRQIAIGKILVLIVTDQNQGIRLFQPQRFMEKVEPVPNLLVSDPLIFRALRRNPRMDRRVDSVDSLVHGPVFRPSLIPLGRINERERVRRSQSRDDLAHLPSSLLEAQS